jgi:peptidoglycan/LPS O-acetylase OafA/YrhL
VLFLTILCDPSSSWIARLFASSRFLKSCGKFSFGIYLCHPAAIHFVKGFSLIVKYKLGFVLSIVFSYLLGFVFYHLLEKHLINFVNFLCHKLALIKIFDTNQINIDEKVEKAHEVEALVLDSEASDSIRLPVNI